MADDGELEGEVMELATSTTTKPVMAEDAEMTPVRPIRPYSLRDHLALVLIELAGGPVPVRLLLKRLRDEGWTGNSSAVTQALKRNPQLFRSHGHGMWKLNLGSEEE